MTTTAKPKLLARLFNGNTEPTVGDVEAQLAALRDEIERLAREREQLADDMIDAYGDDHETQRLSAASSDCEHRLQAARGVLMRLEHEQDEARNRQMRDETQTRVEAVRAAYRQYVSYKASDFAAAERAYQAAQQHLRELHKQIEQMMRELADPLVLRRDELPSADNEAWAGNPLVRQTERLLADVRREINL